MRRSQAAAWKRGVRGCRLGRIGAHPRDRMWGAKVRARRRRREKGRSLRRDASVAAQFRGRASRPLGTHPPRGGSARSRWRSVRARSESAPARRSRGLRRRRFHPGRVAGEGKFDLADAARRRGDASPRYAPEPLVRGSAVVKNKKFERDTWRPPAWPMVNLGNKGIGIPEAELTGSQDGGLHSVASLVFYDPLPGVVSGNRGGGNGCR